MRPYQLTKAERPDTSPHPALADHPLFAGGPVGLMSGENPGRPSEATGHESLKRDLDGMGLRYEEANGHYGIPERSVIIHGPTRDQMVALGRRYGQDAVIHSEGPHKREFIYTGGPNEGASHPQTGTHEHWTAQQGPPDDYWTEIPGRGYVRIGFDFNNMQKPLARAEIRHLLLGTLKKVLNEAP